MQNKNLLFLLCLMFSFTKYFTQNWTEFNSHIQIEYHVKFKSDSLSNVFTNDFLTLYIGDKNSIYQNSNKLKIDSLRATNKDFIIPNRPMFRTSYVVLKDKKNENLRYSDELEGVNLYYDEPITPMKWEIIKEKKEILGFQCLSAITTFRGRKYTAWFTKDIPINDGPYKFNGLPGLILMVEEKNNNFIFEAKQINKKNKKIYYQNKATKTDRQKLIATKINIINQLSSKKPTKTNPLELN